MTQIEKMPGSLFLTTDNREELLDVVQFIVKNYAQMQSRNQKQITLYECQEIPVPSIIHEGPKE